MIRYDEILAWLGDHPNSSARDIGKAIGARDDRLIYGMLRKLEIRGKVQRYLPGRSRAWLWEVTPR